MPALFRKAPEIAAIAGRLIPVHFEGLREHRVHIEYVFSDQELIRNDKVIWGQCVKKGALDRLLMGDEMDDPFDPLTFVCTDCARWRTEKERNTLLVGDTDMDFCDTCYRPASVQEYKSNIEIAKISSKYERAQAKQSIGAPEHPGFFVLKMFEPIWRRLGDEQREYLVFHELCHCGVGWTDGGDSRLFIVPHDIEEFNSCVYRYGPKIKGDIQRFIEEAKKFGQQSLKLDDVDSDRVEAA